MAINAMLAINFNLALDSLAFTAIPLQTAFCLFK